MNRCLQTTGHGYFEEVEYEVPPLTEDEICVRAVMTGVCRSDIDMMQGNFGPLPLHMQGHEGLGRVIGIGANITDVELDDYVATRGEPAYADIYNVRENEYVKVPEAHPRYILEPVACGINVITQALHEISARRNGKIIILGSGFLAWVAYNCLVSRGFQTDVLGASNQELWGDKLLIGTSEEYNVVVDLSGKYSLGTEIRLANSALIIDAVGKAVSKEEAQTQLWKACTTIRPSPRHSNFYGSMWEAKNLVELGKLNVDSFWTRCYNRNTEWQQAFADGVDRPEGYSRGYIKWD
jgi:D-arabinose 1-dehydrogenase-like Zn-dependent alcohol dehydrogenase